MTKILTQPAELKSKSLSGAEKQIPILQMGSGRGGISCLQERF